VYGLRVGLRLRSLRGRSVTSSGMLDRLAHVRELSPLRPPQQRLLSDAIQDWLPEGHLAYFISDSVDNWTIYRALSEPLESLGGRSPADAVMPGSIDDVASALFNVLGMHVIEMRLP